LALNPSGFCNVGVDIGSSGCYPNWALVNSTLSHLIKGLIQTSADTSVPKEKSERTVVAMPTKTLLIRAEDKNRWERRAPIIPEDLSCIMQSTGAKTFIEQSEKRIFHASDYTNVGATSCIGMQDGDVILGVKEIPIEKIIANKTYLFFSHTIKGQKDNMPLLQKIMDSGATLIDYEKITDEKGRRLIYFGPFAGDAGAIDILSLMGEHWNDKGLPNPLSSVRRAHEYASVKDAKQHLEKIGETIRENGFPKR
jgi:saccharopine dehydrogenase (NAD+, L-lysine-forming)